MSGNTIGKLFQVTTFGESHGPAIGCIIDGCPPGLDIYPEDFEQDMARRKPGTHRYVSQRKELDQIEILSGIYENKTLGTPIALLIRNEDAKSKDYEEIKNIFRPGHGDFVYQKKYGIRDYRGGGRQSARETVARVAAAVIAKKYLWQVCDIQILAFVDQIGSIRAESIDLSSISKNHFHFPNLSQISILENYISSLRKQGDSVGSRVQLRVVNMPVGLGAPVFDKLDAELAYALMGINGVKAVEIGDGIEAASSRGSEFRDEMTKDGFVSNHAGGILSGISTGQDIIAKCYFKPASSILISGKTIDINGKECLISTKGRHDPCIGLRGVVIVEAMAALVLMDHLLRNRGQNGNF